MSYPHEKKRPLIGISIGDFNGIGPEIIIKTFSDNRMLDYCTPVIYGSLAVINYHKKALEGRQFNVNQIRDVKEAKPGRINLIQCWLDNVRINFGQRNPENGRYAFLSLKLMAEDAKAGLLDAMVTAPIDKSVTHSNEFHFPGHTEYLTELFGAQDSLMFLCGEQIRIGVVTGHIPVSEVPAAITHDKILRKLELMHQSLEVDFGVRKPVIAVLGLNPHAGEEGLLGNEEQEIIQPAIEEAKSNGMLIMGPYPADGFFGTHMYRNFDAVLGMYHDQGLVPFKLLSFETGVNFTAGLSAIRTSPDHGTAYAIAGKNEANEQSFREAVYLAIEIWRNRHLYAELNRQPLQSQVIKEKEI